MVREKLRTTTHNFLPCRTLLFLTSKTEHNISTHTSTALKTLALTLTLTTDMFLTCSLFAPSRSRVSTMSRHPFCEEEMVDGGHIYIVS